MGVNENREDNRPLGMLGCLMAGFEMLGRNWWLLALPVLLDLFFWLGPQLSIAPLIQEAMTTLESSPWPMPAVQVPEQFIEQFNLFSLLSTMPLLGPPSLLAQHVPGVTSPIGERLVLPVTNGLMLTGWGALLIPAGALLGFAYLNSLARSVYALRSKEKAMPEKPGRKASWWSTALRLIRTLLFATGLLVIRTLIAPIWYLMTGVALAIDPCLGPAIQGLAVGIGGFIILHLVFVIHGVLLGQRGLLRAILESVALTQVNFPSAAGLVLIALLIYQGLGVVWSLPASDSWLLLIGILGNSCIATALITGTFVFYQERIGVLGGRSQRPTIT
jgi:hypothetical protein